MSVDTYKYSFNSSAKVSKRPKFKNYHALKWKWTSRKSIDVQLLNENIVLIHPNKSTGTTAVCVDSSLKRNCYTYWEIDLSDRLFGTSTMIGIGTSRAKLEANAFVNILGIDSNSWGLSHKGKLWHNNQSKSYCDEFEPNKSVTIACIYDGFNGRLFYFKNDHYLGIAFDNIPVCETLYPMVSSTISQAFFKLSHTYQSFQSLQSLSSSIVTKCFKQIPDLFKQFL